MNANRTVATAVIVLAFGVAAAQASAATPSRAAGSSSASELRVGEVPCTPVDTMWPVSPSGSYELQAPRLAVVVTDVRPKDTVVLLDGRVTGRSRYFNGKKGFLFLEAGHYSLTLELEGHRSEAFSITARPGCRFDIRHRMERAGTRLESGYPGSLGKGRPVRWIWEPVKSAAIPVPPGRPGSPDRSLRPDLALPRAQGSKGPVASAGLRLRVTPATASVFLDGAFLVSARELDLMVNSVAVPAGQHLLEVRAPGYASRSEQIDVAAGGLLELQIDLSRKAP